MSGDKQNIEKTSASSQHLFPSTKEIRSALQPEKQPEKQTGPSNRFTDVMMIVIATLFVLYVVLGIFVVIFAKHKSPLATGTFFVFVLDEVLLISAFVVNLSVQSYLIFKEVKAGNWKLDRYKQRLDREAILAERLSEFTDELLEEREERYNMESSLYGYRAGNFPNFVTVSATLLAFFMTAIFTVWFSIKVQQQTVAIELSSLLQPILVPTISLAIVVTLAMYLAKRNADDREFCSRAAWACRKAHLFSGSRPNNSRLQLRAPATWGTHLLELQNISGSAVWEGNFKQGLLP